MPGRKPIAPPADADPHQHRPAQENPVDRPRTRHPATQSLPDNLTARVFRALYRDFDLHTVAGTHIAVPKGTPCFAAPSLGEITRQISDHEHHALPRRTSTRLSAADALPGRPYLAARSEKPMRPPDPFPPPPPGASPARAAADLIHALTVAASPASTPPPPRVCRHLRHRRPDRLDQRPPVLVHPSRPAPDLARRRHRNRCHAPRCPHPPGRRLLTNRPSAAAQHGTNRHFVFNL